MLKLDFIFFRVLILKPCPAETPAAPTIVYHRFAFKNKVTGKHLILGQDSEDRDLATLRLWNLLGNDWTFTGYKSPVVERVTR